MYWRPSPRRFNRWWCRVIPLSFEKAIPVTASTSSVQDRQGSSGKTKREWIWTSPLRGLVRLLEKWPSSPASPGQPTSEALEETHLMALSKEHFDRLMRDFPDIHKAFVKEMRSWLLRDEKRLEIQAQEAYKSLRMTWVDFSLIIAVSLILATIFNYSNPNGIPLFPEFPDRSSFPRSVHPLLGKRPFIRKRSF